MRRDGLRVSQLSPPRVSALRRESRRGVDRAAGGAAFAGRVFSGDLHRAEGTALRLRGPTGTDARSAFRAERGGVAGGRGQPATSGRGTGDDRRVTHVGAAASAPPARALYCAGRRALARSQAVAAGARGRNLSAPGGRRGGGVSPAPSGRPPGRRTRAAGPARPWRGWRALGGW